MTDDEAMALALAQAQLAWQAGEVPVGAVVLRDGQVVGVGRNAPRGTHDPTAHAEVAALRDAAARLGNYRLDGCQLFVTLEPCAMCSGAMLHARLARVVFGAADPKTGAAGSVLDLFALAPLNHRTQVRGGVLAPACSALLRHFFAQRRVQGRAAHPLRDDALRTPEARFAGLPPSPGLQHQVSDLPSLAGWRMQYVDTGAVRSPAGPTLLCLHGLHDWSRVFDTVSSVWSAAGHRVVAPDLVGFGRSDKPKKPSAHQAAWHTQVLGEWMLRLGLEDVVLVLQGGGGLLGLPLAARPGVRGLVTVDGTWTRAGACWAGAPAATAGWAPAGVQDVLSLLNASAAPQDDPFATAPFPDDGHRAGPRALANLPPALALPALSAASTCWSAVAPAGAQALARRVLGLLATPGAPTVAAREDAGE